MQGEAPRGKLAQSRRTEGSVATPLVQPEAARGSQFVPVLSPPPLLTVREVAERLRVCTAVVYKLTASGELPYIRISNAIRVAEPDLAAFLVPSRRQS